MAKNNMWKFPEEFYNNYYSTFCKCNVGAMMIAKTIMIVNMKAMIQIMNKNLQW